MDELAEKSKNLREQLKLYTYYILIAILSLLSVIVFPILNSTADISDTFPKDPTGWVMYCLIRVLVVVMNMLIFTNFLQQSKLNVKDEENYKRANQILGRCKPKDYHPRSPKQYLTKEYTVKGAFLVVSTVASLFVIGNAIINYDYMLLIATVFSVINSIVFGIMTMRKAEIYYVSEYLDYALLIEKKLNEKVTRKEIEECLQSMEKNTEILKSK